MTCCARRRPRIEPERILIREFARGDELALRTVFLSAVHAGTRDFYSKAERNAWAPRCLDERSWLASVAALRPFVAAVDGRIAGYADLQATGLIDHFFVAAGFARRGIGSALMAHVRDVAGRRGIGELSAFVSLAAESFFSAHGFIVSRRQSVIRNGVALRNALMVKRLADRAESWGRNAS